MQLRLSLVEHKEKSGQTDVIVLRQAQRGRWDIASLESVLMHNANSYASDLAASRHFENLDPLDLEKREGLEESRSSMPIFQSSCICNDDRWCSKTRSHLVGFRRPQGQGSQSNDSLVSEGLVSVERNLLFGEISKDIIKSLSLPLPVFVLTSINLLGLIFFNLHFPLRPGLPCPNETV